MCWGTAWQRWWNTTSSQGSGAERCSSDSIPRKQRLLQPPASKLCVFTSFFCNSCLANSVSSQAARPGLDQLLPQLLILHQPKVFQSNHRFFSPTIILDSINRGWAPLLRDWEVMALLQVWEVSECWVRLGQRSFLVALRKSHCLWHWCRAVTLAQNYKCKQQVSGVSPVNRITFFKACFVR